MNHRYRLVFNRSLNLMQVASEVTGGAHGGRGREHITLSPRRPLFLACAAALAMAMTGPAWAGDGNVTISSATDTGNGWSSFNFNQAAGDPDSNIKTSTLVSMLLSSDVTISAPSGVPSKGNIGVQNAIDYTGNVDRTLTFTAGGAISFAAGATLSASGTGKLAGVLSGSKGVIFAAGSGLATNGGDLSVTSTAGAVKLGWLALGTGSLSVTSTAISQNGAIIQAAGAGLVNFDAGTGAITLTDPTNDFSGAVSLTGGITQIADTNALTLGTLATVTLTATSTGALALGQGTVAGNLTATSNGGTISGGALTVSGSSNLQAGSGAITLTNAGNHFAGAVLASGHGVSLVDSGNLTIAALNNGLDGKVSLTAGGLLMLPLSGIDTGTADLTLVANGGSFVTPGLLSGGNIMLAGRDALTLNSSLFTTGIASLSSSNGAINQVGGALYAATLTGSSSGDTTLSGANFVGTLGSFSAANFSLSNAQALTVAGPLTVVGSLNLSTTSGTLFLNTDLSANAATLTSAADLDLAHNVDASTLSLNSGGNISQFGGVLTGGTLTGSSIGNTSLNGANQLDTLGSFSAANFALTNAQALAVNGPLTMPGSLSLTTTAGALAVNGDLSATSVTLNSATDLALAHDINATTLALVGGGNITQSAGVLTAAALTGTSTGNTALNGANLIDTLSIFSAANFSLTNAKTLAVNGPLTVPGSLSLTTTAGALMLNGDLSASTLTLSSATDLDLAHHLNAQALALHTNANISQSAGVLTAVTLTGTSLGNTALNGANQVDTLSSFSAANFSLTNAKALAVNGPLTMPGSLSLTTTAGALAVNGDLSANAVSLNSATDLDLAHNVTATTLALMSGANISQSGGVLTAATLTGSSIGGTALNGANRLDTLGSFSAPNFSFTNAKALAVNGPITVPGSLSLTTTHGALMLNTDLSANAATLTSAADLDLAHNVDASTLSLNSGGNISQFGGVLTGGTLTGSSIGNTSLNGANQLDTLGSFSAANFALTNAQALAITGTLSAANITLNNNAGIVVSGAINATGTTTIGSGTSLQIGSGGAITGNVANNGSLAFNRNDAVNFAGAISGSGSLTQSGSGVLILSGTNTYAGGTTVSNGTLLVGDSAHAGASIVGNVGVAGGASLGGHGTIGGDVLVASGAHLAPGGSIGTLTVTGNFTAAQGSVLDYEFGAPGANATTFGSGDSVNVGGNLNLNGATLNITDAGGYGAGLYNLFTYGGTLTQSNGGITLGTTPGGTYTIQNLTASKQVNLLNGTGLTLNLWNANSGAGGNGTWTTTSANWTDASGSISAAMSPQPGFAIFGGAAGTVTVDDNGGASPVSATGLQFASDGYSLAGDTLTMVGPATIRVGDGSATGAGYTATISNVLAGIHGLTKTDLGTLILAGANTYSGGTTISGGNLQGDTTSLHGNIVNNAALVINQNAAGTFAGTLSGNGSLTKTGSGVLALSGTNTYSGGTTISGGTLQGDTNSLHGNIVDNAALVFNQNAAGTFASAISGSGSLTKSGSGVLTLSGTNTYDGGTTISGGTLQGDTNSLQGNIVDNAALVFNQNAAGTFDSAVSGNGSLTKSGSGVLTLSGANTYSGGTTISGGTLQGDTTSLHGNIVNNAALVIAQNTAGTFAGTLSGNGSLTKTGAALLVLDSQNMFTGNTTVKDGTLEVGDATTPSAFLGGNVQVAVGGTLRGHGTIGGNVINAGRVWPGGSIGTLTIQGNYTQAAGSTFNIDATPAGQASSLQVGGSATLLGGSTVVLAQTGNWAPQTGYTILTAAGGVSGQFATATSSLAFLNPVLSYTANAVNLSLQRNDISFSTVAHTRNQRAAANAASVLGFGNPLYDALVKLDAPTAQQAFNQLSGEIHASTRTAMIDDSRHVRDAVNRHLLGLDHNGVEGVTDQGTSVWVSTWGHRGHHDSDGNAALMQANGSGFLVGADLALGSDTRLGAALGRGQSSIQADSISSSAHVRADHIGVYASSAFGAFALRAGAVYSSQDVNSNRAVAFSTYSEGLTSKHHAQTTHAYLEGGYQFNVSTRQQLEPFVNISHVRVHNDALQETGGAAALAVTGNSTSVNVATLGLHDTLVLDTAGHINAHASVAWQQTWGDLTPLGKMRFAGASDSFAVTGVPMARHAVTTDLGIDFKVAKSITMSASYIGQFASSVRDQGARVSLFLTF